MPADVSNLGRGPSKRFAEDQQKYDPSIRKDSPQISRRTQVAVLAPSRNSLDELIIESKTTKPQAAFSPPDCYEGYSKPTFLSQLTPGTAAASSWDSRSEKMLGVVESLGEDDPAKEPLKKFVQTVNEIERSVTNIRAEVNRYHRG